MGFRDRMKKKKKKFKKRTQRPEDSGGRFPTIFNKKKIPDGVGFYKCGEGEHIADVIPFEAGPDMPHDPGTGEPVTAEGEFDFILDLRVHQNVGSLKLPFVCPYENFGLPCPICEYIKANRLDKEEWKTVSPKRRSIYLLWSRTDKESEKKGIQIFDASYFFMQEKIAEVAKLPRGGGNVEFADEDEGKHIAWTRKGSGKENTSYLGHRLLDRDRPIPDKILDKSFSLDQCVNMHPSYEEIEKAFYGTKKKKSDDSGSKKKKKKSKYKINEIPEEDDIDDSKWDNPKKKKKKKKSSDSGGKSSKKKKKSSEESTKKKKKKKSDEAGKSSKTKKKKKKKKD